MEHGFTHYQGDNLMRIFGIGIVTFVLVLLAGYLVGVMAPGAGNSLFSKLKGIGS